MITIPIIMSRFTELTDKIIPLIAKSGRLGSEVQFVKCILDNGSSGESQFASSICFVKAIFMTSNMTFEQLLIVKYNMQDEAVRNWRKLNEQFQNEVIVYENILPFLKVFDNNCINNLFPKYFFGLATSSVDPDQYVLILEDLRATGFKLCPVIFDLDFAHCALAFKKLGCFHALSFAAKQLNQDEFFDQVNTLVETKLFIDQKDDWEYLYKKTVVRASKPLLEKGKHTEKILSFINNLDDIYLYMKNILMVKEPMGVICHGDFNRNNMLFKYENDTPIDIKFFDLATARYGSPMLDFTFFYWLNCSEESRLANREQFLNIYYSSLTSTIPGINIPPFDSFIEEFHKKAVYGFLLCAFFKPSMMHPEPFNPSVEVRRTRDERASRLLSYGGDQATNVIANMLNELLELKYVP